MYLYLYLICSEDWSKEWIDIWTEEKKNESLLKHRKGQILSEIQKAYLAKKLEVYSDQKIKYVTLSKLSESIIRRIVRERKRNISEVTSNTKEMMMHEKVEMQNLL